MKKKILALGMLFLFMVTMYSCVSTRTMKTRDTSVHSGPKTSGPKPPKNP
jgi:hypothetical protein